MTEVLDESRSQRSLVRNTYLDTTIIKTLDTPDSVEIRLRVLFNGIMVAVLCIVYEMWGMIGWYVLRFALLGLWSFTLRRLPDRLSFPKAVAFGALVFVEASSFVGLSIYFWIQPQPELMAFSIAVVAASMIATIWTRTRSIFLWSIEAIVVGACLFTLPFLYVRDGASLLEGAFMALLFGMMLVYFVLALWSIWKSSRELERAQQAEMQRTKVEAIGRLTGGVAHDFNNLLTVILGNIELARLTADAAERDGLMAEAHAAGTRAARLTTQLLGFSRQSVLSPQRVRVADVVASACGLLKRLLPANIMMEVSDQIGDAPPVHLDPGKLEAVLMNLALNARDAMPKGGHLRFDATRVVIGGPGSQSSPALDPGAYVALDVSDTGTGIPQELLAQVTEPFFTTKAVGEGSGLGLSMAQGFAEQSGGALKIDSGSETGTRVRIYLPVAP